MHLENKHNIIVLCNNELAFPAIRELAFYGSLKAIVVPENNREVFGLLKQFLAQADIKLVTVNKKNLQPVLESLVATIKATTVWLMTFPYIISSSILSLLPGAFINFHYGLLPKYRGPNPVLAQMLNYETHGGVTVHVMDEQVDTGPVILQHKVAIEDNDTFGMQLQKLALVGAEMSVHLLKILNFSTVLPSTPQDGGKAGYYDNVTAAQLMIRWNEMSSRQIIRLINACNPWNKGAGATIHNNIVCFVEAEITEDVDTETPAPGTITKLDYQDGLRIYCIDGKIIRVNIIYLPEGFFSAKKLIAYGVKANDRFV